MTHACSTGDDSRGQTLVANSLEDVGDVVHAVALQSITKEDQGGGSEVDKTRWAQVGCQSANASCDGVWSTLR